METTSPHLTLPLTPAPAPAAPTAAPAPAAKGEAAETAIREHTWSPPRAPSPQPLTMGKRLSGGEGSKGGRSPHAAAAGLRDQSSSALHLCLCPSPSPGNSSCCEACGGSEGGGSRHRRGWGTGTATVTEVACGIEPTPFAVAAPAAAVTPVPDDRPWPPLVTVGLAVPVAASLLAVGAVGATEGVSVEGVSVRRSTSQCPQSLPPLHPPRLSSLKTVASLSLS